jgi:hypothetical protein
VYRQNGQLYIDERVNLHSWMEEQEATTMPFYKLITHEPDIRPEDVDPLIQGSPVLYATREEAELAAEEYNRTFRDPIPATVVEADFDVN